HAGSRRLSACEALAAAPGAMASACVAAACAPQQAVARAGIAAGRSLARPGGSELAAGRLWPRLLRHCDQEAQGEGDEGESEQALDRVTGEPERKVRAELRSDHDARGQRECAAQSVADREAP